MRLNQSNSDNPVGCTRRAIECRFLNKNWSATRLEQSPVKFPHPVDGYVAFLSVVTKEEVDKLSHLRFVDRWCSTLETPCARILLHYEDTSNLCRLSSTDLAQIVVST